MASIHPTSIVDPRAQLAESVVVGPFCTIGGDVVVGPDTWIQSHVVLTGHTTIGAENRIFAGSAIGIEPQDLKYRGESTRLEIGDKNIIRENCTVAVGTIQDEGLTKVGNGNLLMANTHIAHDCRIGNGIIIANNVALAGHVWVDDDAILGGLSGIHQFVRIGRGAMLSGGSMMRQDVLPFCYIQGNPGSHIGINLEGMKRHGWSKAALRAARDVYKWIFREGKTVEEAAEEIKAFIDSSEDEQAREVATIMLQAALSSTRGLAR